MKITKFDKNQTKTWIYIGIIACLSLVLRLVLLDRVPSGMTADEQSYILTAKALYLTGSDLTGRWNPLSLSPVPDAIPLAEFPNFIPVSFVGPTRITLFLSRLPYAIIGTFLVLAIFGIIYLLVGLLPAIYAGLIAAVNPWAIYFSRTAYDVPVAVFLYILGLYVLLKNRRWMILLAFIPLALGFFSYIGMKLVFVPYSAVIIFWSYFYFHKKRDILPHIILMILCLMLFVFYSINIKNQITNNRMSQLYSLRSEKVSINVDEERKLSVVSPLRPMFSNKITVYLREIITRYINAFDTKLLFTNGEGVSTYALWYHGIFYFVEIVFFLVGLYYLFRYHREIWFLLVFLILVSPIPSLFSNVNITYAHRSSLMYPFMIFIMGFGVYYICEKEYNSKKSKYAKIIILIIYIFSTANFLYLYLFRFSIYNAENFGFSMRIFSRFMELAQIHETPLVFLTDSPEGVYRNYIFYRGNLNKTLIEKYRNMRSIGSFTDENIRITSDCPTKLDKDTIYILNVGNKCLKFFPVEETSGIPILSDAGILYKIYHDRICSKFGLNKYPSNITFQDLNLEKLSEDRFCRAFITKIEVDDFLKKDASRSGASTLELLQ